MLVSYLKWLDRSSAFVLYNRILGHVQRNTFTGFLKIVLFLPGRGWLTGIQCYTLNVFPAHALYLVLSRNLFRLALKDFLDRTQIEEVFYLNMCVCVCLLSVGSPASGVVDGRLLSFSSTGAQPEATKTQSSTEIHIPTVCLFCYVTWLYLYCVSVFPDSKRPNNEATFRQPIFNLQEGGAVRQSDEFILDLKWVSQDFFLWACLWRHTYKRLSRNWSLHHLMIWRWSTMQPARHTGGCSICRKPIPLKCCLSDGIWVNLKTVILPQTFFPGDCFSHFK